MIGKKVGAERLELSTSPASRGCSTIELCACKVSVSNKVSESICCI